MGFFRRVAPPARRLAVKDPNKTYTLTAFSSNGLTLHLASAVASKPMTLRQCGFVCLLQCASLGQARAITSCHLESRAGRGPVVSPDQPASASTRRTKVVANKTRKHFEFGWNPSREEVRKERTWSDVSFIFPCKEAFVSCGCVCRPAWAGLVLLLIRKLVVARLID